MNRSAIAGALALLCCAASAGAENYHPASFETLDRDGDGYIGRAELPVDSVLQPHFVIYDLDNDRRLTAEEYANWVDTLAARDEPNNFNQLDRNRDGFVDATELTRGPIVVSNFDSYDVDADGRLSRTEYDAWFALSVDPNQWVAGEDEFD